MFPIIASIACILGVGIAGIYFANAAFLQRFPTTSASIEEINARPGALANTRAAFAGGADGNKVPFRVLFYGQSIIGSGWPDHAMPELQKRHPNVAFKWENRAIGGFSAEHLTRVATADLADVSPDLIVFHVYGDHRAYTEIIEEMLRTGADILLQNHHANVWPDSRAEIGFSLFPGKRPGSKGWPFRRQSKWADYISYHFIPAMADKHNMAVMPVRTLWADRLRKEGLEPHAVLKDDVHMNDIGIQWMAEMFVDYITLQTDGQRDRPHRQIAPLPESNTDGQYIIETTARRIELVSTRSIGDVVVTIDGRPIAEVSSCVVHSRPSPNLPNHPWPGIRGIQSDTDLIPEVWTATVSGFSPDFKDFEFDVEGTATGRDGAGRSGEMFRSDSGRVIIDPSDWTAAMLYERHGTQVEDPLTITWEDRFICADEDTIPEGPFTFRTLAANLDSKSHKIAFSLPEDQRENVLGLLLTESRLDR